MTTHDVVMTPSVIAERGARGAARRGPDRADWTARLAVVGTTFRRVGLGRLGELVLAPDDLAGRMALRAALGAEELVYLGTCNRLECYVVLPEVTPAGELRARLAAFFAGRGVVVGDGELEASTGAAALEHLFSVSGSLESLIVGETDIVGQVRRAAAEAARIDLCRGPLLGVLERATAVARQVHTRLGGGRASRSVATIALEKVRAHFGAQGPGTTVFVGTGETVRKIAAAMAGLGGERIFVGRSAEKATALARDLGGRALALERLLDQPLAWLDLLVTATSATGVVLPASALAPALAARARASCPRPLIVCDLGVPRDVDPSIDHVPGVHVVTLDVIQRLQRASSGVSDADLAAARRVVAREARRVVREDRFRRIADESARSLVDGRLGHLRDDDREQVLRFAAGLAGRLARHRWD